MHSRIMWMQARKLSISNSFLLLSSRLLWFLPEDFTACSFDIFPFESLSCCPHLSNLTPVCNFTFRILYSLSLLVFLTPFSHNIAVFSEVRAKVTQMLSMKTQPGIRDGWALPEGPYQGWSLNETSPHFHTNDISYGLAVICLLIFLSAIKKTTIFPTFTY